MEILIICPGLPYPPVTGDSIRIYNTIKELSINNIVEIISISKNALEEKEALVELSKYCNKIHLVEMEKRNKIFQILPILRKIIKGVPYRTKYAETSKFGEKINKITKNKKYEIIQFELIGSAINLQYVNQSSNALTVCVLHNISFLQYLRMYNREKNYYKKARLFLDWFPMLSWEPEIAGQFDKIFVVSEIDKTLLRALNPNLNPIVAPNGVDTKKYIPFPMNGRKKNILFVGSLSYYPNIDAVHFLCNEIFPLIKKAYNGVTLTIAGRNPGDAILAYQKDPLIEVLGNVIDISACYRKSYVSVVPLRSGGGTRLKVLESMAFGTPVISTSIGCEGIDVQDNENIFLANNPDQFVEKILSLFNNDNEWTRVSRNGRSLVEEKYCWSKIIEDMKTAYMT